MIDIGRERCTACNGAGYVWPPPAGESWLRCAPCDGLGQVWQAGGPSFGAPLGTIGQRGPGDRCTLATGHRVRVLWQMPRKRPHTTFVAVIDDFDDTESRNPVPVHASIGVASIAGDVETSALRGDADPHDHDKDADLVDPLAARARADGPLL